MELELLMCRFIRYLRDGHFPLYVQVCDELCAWFRVMDHTNSTQSHRRSASHEMRAQLPESVRCEFLQKTVV